MAILKIGSVGLDFYFALLSNRLTSTRKRVERKSECSSWPREREREWHEIDREREKKQKREIVLNSGQTTRREVELYGR